MGMDTQLLDRDYLSVEQAARYLQCSTRTIHRYLKAGLLSGSQIVPLGVIRISALSIEKLLERRRI